MNNVLCISIPRLQKRALVDRFQINRAIIILNFHTDFHNKNRKFIAMLIWNHPNSIPLHVFVANLLLRLAKGLAFVAAPVPRKQNMS